ncbi:hypothetical protein FAI40_08655 [Acetobacteraceae bacterium]|nr:hypothetical protein FAI40_08655 [Acetobacteraceae bacterium]
MSETDLTGWEVFPQLWKALAQIAPPSLAKTPINKVQAFDKPAILLSPWGQVEIPPHLIIALFKYSQRVRDLKAEMVEEYKEKDIQKALTNKQNEERQNRLKEQAKITSSEPWIRFFPVEVERMSFKGEKNTKSLGKHLTEILDLDIQHLKNIAKERSFFEIEEFPKTLKLEGKPTKYLMPDGSIFLKPSLPEEFIPDRTTAQEERDSITPKNMDLRDKQKRRAKAKEIFEKCRLNSVIDKIPNEPIKSTYNLEYPPELLK